MKELLAVAWLLSRVWPLRETAHAKDKKAQAG